MQSSPETIPDSRRESNMSVCQHCGFESQGVPVCPLCGTSLESAPARQAEAPGAMPAWEDPVVGFPMNLVVTWRDSVFSPARFFETVAWEKGIGRPILYYLSISIIAAVFTLFWESTGINRALMSSFGAALDEAPYSPLINFFLTPFASLIGLFVWAGVVHLFCLMLAPERRGYGATTRVLCYASGPAVFSAIPFGGVLITMVLYVVLQIFGVQHAHRVTGGRAAAIVLLPLAVLVVAFAALFAIAIALIGLSLTEF